MYPPYGAPPISQARPKRKQVKMAVSVFVFSVASFANTNLVHELRSCLQAL